MPPIVRAAGGRGFPFAKENHARQTFRSRKPHRPHSCRDRVSRRSARGGTDGGSLRAWDRTAGDCIHALLAAERTARGLPRGPFHTGRRGQCLVSRRFDERVGRPYGLCPPVRAHDVPGVPGIPVRVRRDHGRARRVAKRLDQHRSNELLRGRSIELPGYRALHGSRPDGAPPANRSRRSASTTSATSSRTRNGSESTTSPTVRRSLGSCPRSIRASTPTAGQ